MKVEEIMKALEERGYQCAIKTEGINGREGLAVFTEGESSGLFILLENLERFDSVDEAVKVISENTGTINKEVEEDISNKLNDKEWVLSHLYIRLQKASNQDLVKKETEFEGIEQYIRIAIYKDGRSLSTNLTKASLWRLGIDEDEAWEHALKNTKEETDIFDLMEGFWNMVKEIGMNLDIENEMPLSKYENIYVVTNKSKYQGASCVLNKTKLKELAGKHDTERLIMMPSSIHEVLVIPYTSEINEDDLGHINDVIFVVNGTEVLEHEQLGDRFHIIEV